MVRIRKLSLRLSRLNKPFPSHVCVFATHFKWKNVCVSYAHLWHGCGVYVCSWKLLLFDWSVFSFLCLSAYRTRKHTRSSQMLISFFFRVFKDQFVGQALWHSSGVSCVCNTEHALKISLYLFKSWLSS